MSKKIFSGVQPTGNLHLGNYLVAIKNFVDLNNNSKNECIFCVVDLHAITVKQNPKELKNKAINIDAPHILIKLIRNILLKENKFLFFRKINSNNAFSQDEIVVAIGMMMKPISLK